MKSGNEDQESGTATLPDRLKIGRSHTVIKGSSILDRPTSGMLSFRRLFLAGSGGVLGVIIAFAVNWVLPRPFESSVILQVAKDPPRGMNTPGRSVSEAVQGFKADEVLKSLVESKDLIADGKMPTVDQLRSMVRVDRVPDSYLFRVTVTHSDGDLARRLVASLVKAHEKYFNEDFKKRALEVFDKDREAEKIKYVRLGEVRSKIKKVLPEYFKQNEIRECSSEGEQDMGKLVLQRVAYLEKKAEIEKNDPEFVSICAEFDRLNRLLVRHERTLMVLALNNCSFSDIVEDASPPEKSAITQLPTKLASGGFLGVSIFSLIAGIQTGGKKSGSVELTNGNSGQHRI